MSLQNLLSQRKEKLRELLELDHQIREASEEVSKNLGNEQLSNTEIVRYSRQLILPEFGIAAQRRLKNSKVLVVGCGGLGCPAAQYLASCGVGTLGLVDFDQVEESNLHRQVLHVESRVGLNKAQSIKMAVKALNSIVRVCTHEMLLNSSNALEVIRNYDVVLDATDNVATRYLLNDACVLENKVLVSGSALRFEGQLTVYNYKEGPTYRCLFPDPPPASTVTNCSEGGVLGVVPGVIGVLQALEAIKIIADVGEVMAGKLLIFDGLQGSFRAVKLRPRQLEGQEIHKLIDYEQFCGAGAHDKDEPLQLLQPDDRISPETLKEKISGGEKQFALLDVRSKPEMDICSLPGSFNVPMGDLERGKTDEITSKLEGEKTELVVVCRRGNDSQRAVMLLKPLLSDSVKIRDVRGGLHAWAKDVDDKFPVY